MCGWTHEGLRHIWLAQSDYFVSKVSAMAMALDPDSFAQIIFKYASRATMIASATKSTAAAANLSKPTVNLH